MIIWNIFSTFAGENNYLVVLNHFFRYNHLRGSLGI